MSRHQDARKNLKDPTTDRTSGSRAQLHFESLRESLRKSFFTLSTALFCLASTGCVSVNITPSEAEKSKGVSYAAPGDAFVLVKSERADAAWSNTATGSTIAFQSSCGETSDASLESIAQDLFGGFDEIKDLRSERIPFDGREALARDVEGKVDGVTTVIRSIVYKKNKCSYVLTLVSLAKDRVADNRNKAATNGDTAAFERFTSNFKAP